MISSGFPAAVLNNSIVAGNPAKIVGKVKAVDIDKEIIIVNDASTDSTPRLLAGLAQPPSQLRPGVGGGEAIEAEAKHGLAHAASLRQLLDPERLREVVLQPLDGLRELMAVASGRRDLPGCPACRLRKR